MIPKKLILQFKETEDSIFAIVSVDDMNPTMIGALEKRAVDTDSMFLVDFKGICLGHVNRLVQMQGLEVIEVTKEVKE